MLRHKHNGSILVAVVLLTALGMGGCVRNSEHEVGTVYVNCRAVMSKNTRSEDLIDTYPIDQDFALWALQLPRGKSWKEHSAEALPLLTSERFTGNPADTVWYSQQTVEWPYTKALNFVAYSPFEAEGSFDLERGITFDNYNITEHNYDLMYTDPIEDQLKENNVRGVPIPFYHALCKVDMRAKTIISTHTITIKKVTIKNLHFKGSFASFASTQWTTEEETADFTVYDSTAGTTLKILAANDLYNSARLFLPQRLSNACIEVEYTQTDGKTVTTHVAQTPTIQDEWKSGKYYTYTLEVKTDGVGLEEIKKE